MKTTALSLLLALLLCLLCACNTDQSIETESTSDAESETAESVAEETDQKTVDRKFLLTRRTGYHTDGKEITRTEFVYNEFGNQVSSLTYSNDLLQQREDFTYDQNQRLIRKIFTYFLTETPESYIYEYEYDEQGNVITQRTTSTTGMLSIAQYEYDSQGRLKKVTQNNGKIIEHSYPNGNSCIIIEHFSVGDLTHFQQIKETYDARGNLINRTEYKEDSYDEIRYEHIYSYDEQGNQIKYEIYLDGEQMSDTQSEYDGEQLKRILNYLSGSLRSIEEYEYDENDNLRKKTTKIGSGMTIQYSLYEYEELP